MATMIPYKKKAMIRGQFDTSGRYATHGPLLHEHTSDDVSEAS